MINPNDDLLLRIAQGDAFAMSCEYIKHPRDDQVLSDALMFNRYIAHPTHTLKAGSYTDDTQMSIAVAEVLLSNSKNTRDDFTSAFVNCFCRDPRDGYSRGFQAILEASAKVPQPVNHFKKTVLPTSTKNGACMRAVPIGVLKDIPELLDVAAVQASVTHNTPEGIWSSQVVALMSHFALHDSRPLSDMGQFIYDSMPDTISTLPVFPSYTTVNTDVRHWNVLLNNGFVWNSKVNSKYYPPDNFYGVGISTALACLTLVQSSSDLIGMMKSILLLGGDTDSVAAIAWGIASSRMKQALPDFLECNLEPGRKYGVPFLKELGCRLMAKFG